MKRFLSGLLVISFLGASACSGMSRQSESSHEYLEITNQVAPTSEQAPSEEPEFDLAQIDGVVCSYGETEDTYYMLEEYKSGTEPIVILGRAASLSAAGEWTEAMNTARWDVASAIGASHTLFATRDISLPTEMDGFSVTWSSSDESLIEPSGKVHCPHDQSRSLILIAHFSDGNALEFSSYYAARVMRDTYAQEDPSALPVLTDEIENALKSDDPNTREEAMRGWYVFQSLDQLLLYDPNPDRNVSLYDDSRAGGLHYSLSGKLCGPTVESSDDALLLIMSLSDVLDIRSEVSELRYFLTKQVAGDIEYHFRQYFRGILVEGGEVVVTACHDTDAVKIRINFHEIPDDLWTTPYQSAKYVENAFGLEDVRLEIIGAGESAALVYYGWGEHGETYIDALTGEFLYAVRRRT